MGTKRNFVDEPALQSLAQHTRPITGWFALTKGFIQPVKITNEGVAKIKLR